MWFLVGNKQGLAITPGLFGPCQIYFQAVNRANFFLREAGVCNLPRWP